MKKNILAVFMAVVIIFSMAACATPPADIDAAASQIGDTNEGATPGPTDTINAEGEQLSFSNVKVGFVHVGDPSDMGYTYNHDLGTQNMMKALGLSENQVLNKFNISEDDNCAAALRELAEDGCNIIFATSHGFEPYVQEVAAEYLDIQFCHANGYMAPTGEPNTHNYFGRIHEARYLSGIVAGMKAKEIGNPKLGYVAAFPYAEIVSGFTAFYLGAKSVYPEVTMKIMYTGSWNDPTKEAQNTQALADAGCGVISQHCDSSAPATAAQKAGIFQVGYNSPMIDVAPNASLTSAVWDWSKYLVFAVTCVVNGETIPPDWAGGLSDGVCNISALNEALIADGSKEAVETARTAIMNGTLQVFAGPLHGFSAEGEEITIEEGDYYEESIKASCPSWYYILDGCEVVK